MPSLKHRLALLAALASACTVTGRLGHDLEGNADSAADDGDGGSSDEADSGGWWPEPIDAGGAAPGACGLPSPAFCETFSTAHPGGRGGDLDETVWSMARWAHRVEHLWVRAPARTYTDRLFPATFCGAAFSGILPEDDARICEGLAADGTMSMMFNEVFDDQGDYAVHSMRIRQPFDFTDRTGTVVFDVDAKVQPFNLGHGWWVELWITEDPMPIPHDELSSASSYPERGIGFALRHGADCPEAEDDWQSGLETVIVVDGHAPTRVVPFWELEKDEATRCFRCADGRLNHLELRISTDRAELWVSDYDDPDDLILRGAVSDLDLPFSRGFVHLQHGQFDAAKDGVRGCSPRNPTLCATPSQTFRWDDIGFDGPTYPTPRSYEVPNNTEPGPDDTVRFGWLLDDGLPRTFTVTGVDPRGAVAAQLSFSVFAAAGQTLQYRVNGGTPSTFVVPTVEGAFLGTSLRGHSVPVDPGDLVAGDNTIEVVVLDPVFVEGIGNIDLTIEVEP
jgi:hypothetical protein